MSSKAMALPFYSSIFPVPVLFHLFISNRSSPSLRRLVFYTHPFNEFSFDGDQAGSVPRMVTFNIAEQFFL